jgi:hypothetical protein
MESLGYVLVYFLRGNLPWQGLEAGEGEDIDKIVGEKKRATSIKDLCEGLPEEFVLYFEHLGSVKDGKPDHAYLHRLFKRLFSRMKYEYDFVFDWTILKFFESLEQEKSDGHI